MSIVEILDKIDGILYYPILIVILSAAGIYFTLRTRAVQLRMFPEACKQILEPPPGGDKEAVSSFQALMVSTASRVGTGNIVGVSTAICLGGPGAVFWMWVLAILGGASAFVESTLAQVYKRRDEEGGYYGGPAYYIEQALHAPLISKLFCIFLILTYAFGFNLLCSYNLQTTFQAYSFYNPQLTPVLIGAVLAILVGYCLFGGGKRIVDITSVIVPFMGVSYVIIALIVLVVNAKNLPAMFGMIFADAFDFKSILGGISGSCMIYGIKRGLYSNEAGVGSAPNAAAAADVSHPVKQGLVQALSVYIDTILLCTATALMCLSTGVPFNEEVSGAPYVQNAISSVFGPIGPLFITCAMILFAFTTLLGNLFYTVNALNYLNNKQEPSEPFMRIYYVICAIIIFVGAILPATAVWALADITMGGMAFFNLPSCIALSGVAIAALKDYEKQKAAGKNPVFKARDIGMDDSELDCWAD